MSLLWQLHPQYGTPDVVWILRDVDLVLGLWSDHPELAALCVKMRERTISILSENPGIWGTLRNDFFRAKNPVVTAETLSGESKDVLHGVDQIHTEYKRLMLLRQLMQNDPETTLKTLVDSIESSLQAFPLKKESILLVSEKVDGVTPENFSTSLEQISREFWHIGVISFYEWCIAEWKCLDQIVSSATSKRDDIETNKTNSMEYWDFTSIINLVSTREKCMSVSATVAWGKSFVLSGGGGNGFTQLAVMQKYVENGGKVRSISGTSMGAAIGILVGSIGNNAARLKELMNDLVLANNSGEIPEKLRWNEFQMIAVFERLRVKYGIDHTTKFSDLAIPVVVNVWRQYKWWEQEIMLGGDEEIIPSILASMNVPFPHKNNNIWALGKTPIHGVDVIDYAANERGNPTHWLELLGEKQKDLVCIDVWYSSENGWSPFVRRLFQRATIRDFLAKLRIRNAGWGVMDIPLSSSEWYIFTPWTMERFFRIWEIAFEDLAFQD